MDEYIVEFDTTNYYQMVADGIINPTNIQTLKGMPVRGEIIRCRDCRGSKDGPWHRCETYITNGEDPDGFCAWAERDSE